MSEWFRQYTYDDQDIISQLQRYLDSGNYDFEFYDGFKWKKKTGSKIKPNVDYRYKEKEDEHLDYEFFKDMPPMQITDKSESYISDVILRTEDHLSHDERESYYKWLAENGYKWRVLESRIDLNKPPEKGIKLQWSEWKTFKRGD